MNIRNIFITTGISVIFGVYSIYNIFEFLRYIHYSRLKELSELNNIVNETKIKHKQLEGKYYNLQSKYDMMIIDLINTKDELSKLNGKILEIHSIINKQNISTPPNSIIESEYIGSEHSSIICDDMCDMNLDIPRINMGTMDTSQSNHYNIDDPEFIESLNFDYNHPNIVISQNNLDSSYHSTNSMRSAHSYSNSDKSARSRSVSVTDINWTTLTKKFFFG